MEAWLVVSVVLSAMVGFSLGLFGGGGSILAVPILVYVTHIAPPAAIGMSLAIVGATSLTASYAHYRKGRVKPRVALVFGGSGVFSALFAARLTHLVPASVLMLSFAFLMVVVGVAMFRRGRSLNAEASTPKKPQLIAALLAGAAVGAITGFLGVGGGFLVVPALLAFSGLDMREAVGTSLLVIAINSAAGFIGHLGTVGLRFDLVAGFTIAAVIGSMLGERVACRLSVGGLSRGFALFVTMVGVSIASFEMLG